MIPLFLVLYKNQELILLERGRVPHLGIPRVRHPSHPSQAVSLGKDPRREQQNEMLDVASSRMLSCRVGRRVRTQAANFPFGV